MFGREDVDRVAPDSEGPAREFHVGAPVLHTDDLPDQIALGLPIARTQDEAHLGVALGRADAVNRRDRRHDDGVAPLENRLRCRKPHLFDVFVHRSILLDEEIPRRHVGFRLIEVVVGNEVFDGVLREEVAHLGIGLSGERLVGRKDDCRHPFARNHIRHRVGLSRSRHPEERLVHEPVLHAPAERLNRLGLVACRGKGFMKDEGRIRIGDDLQGKSLTKKTDGNRLILRKAPGAEKLKVKTRILKYQQ